MNKLPERILFGVMQVISSAQDEAVISGRLEGCIHVGDELYISNPGEDEELLRQCTVRAIATQSGSAKEASDCAVTLRLSIDSDSVMRVGTLLFSADCETQDMRRMYCSCLGDTYVASRGLDIADDEYEALSLADCAEIYRLFVWFQTKMVKNESEQYKQEQKERLARLKNAMAKKLLAAQRIHCVFSKVTGEPYMLSRTVDKGDGTYFCSPPCVMLHATQSAASAARASLDAQKYEIRTIERGTDGRGIYIFLGSIFYLNGACAVTFAADETPVEAALIADKPDYSNIPPQNIPVTNPDLMRWMLLLAQLGKPEGDAAQKIYAIYYRFMSLELLRAKLLIPMRHSNELGTPDENGKILLAKGTKIEIATTSGKDERPAVRMYTDWKRLRMAFGEEWGGMVQPVSGMIGTFDCAVNTVPGANCGGYISAQMYAQMTQALKGGTDDEQAEDGNI